MHPAPPIALLAMEDLRASSLELTPTTEHSATATVPTPASTQAPSKRRSAAIIACITCITGISNLLAGLLTPLVRHRRRPGRLQAGMPCWRIAPGVQRSWCRTDQHVHAVDSIADPC